MKIGILSKAAAAAAAVFALNNLQAAPKEYFALPLFDKDTGAPIEMVPKYYDSIIKDKKYHHLTLDEWFNAPHATANVYGLRRYAERGGIVPSVAYVGNFAANTCGGMSRGADNSSSVNLGLGVNLKELTDIEELPTKFWVGITHTAESNLTTEALARCSSAIDGLSIMVFTDTINNLYKMLENYELDLAIVEGTGCPEAFSSLVLNTDFLISVMSPENHLAHNAMITLDELKREPLILRLPSSATRIQFDSELRGLNDSPDSYNIILEVDNIATIKDLVKKNLGISVLPESACLKELRKGSLIALPIENLSMARETRLVYNKDFSRKDVLQAITATYRETVGRYQ